MEYKGWIPTVTGRLSFDFFGDSDCPSEAISQNISDSVSRYAIIYQKRRLSDATLPCKHRTARLFFNLQTVFWYVCLGFSSEIVLQKDSCANQGSTEPSLEGILYIFQDDKIWIETAKKLIEPAQSILEKFSSRDPLIKGNLREFDKKYNELSLKLREEAMFCAKYELARNGILTLAIDESLPPFKNAPKFPKDLNKKNHLQHIVCSQLFFFLRDIGHRHQHHHPTTDTIIDLYPSSSDDATWRRETLRSLCRKAVEFKRGKRYELYSSALGVLAYIKSFQYVNDTENPTVKVLPGFNVDALEKGINAAIHSYNFQINQKSARNDTIRNIVIAIFALFISFIGLYQLIDAKKIIVSNETLVFFETYIGCILDHPKISLLFLPALLLFIAFCTQLIDIFNLQITRDYSRILLTLNKNLAFFIASSVALIAGYFTIKYVFF